MFALWPVDWPVQWVRPDDQCPLVMADRTGIFFICVVSIHGWFCGKLDLGESDCSGEGHWLAALASPVDTMIDWHIGIQVNPPSLVNRHKYEADQLSWLQYMANRCNYCPVCLQGLSRSRRKSVPNSCLILWDNMDTVGVNGQHVRHTHVAGATLLRLE